MSQFEWDEEAENKFSECFDQLDKDESGNLTFDELKRGGLQQGTGAVGGPEATDEDIDNFIQTCDKDGDGAVSKDEFRQFLKDFIAMLQEQMSKAEQEQAPTKKFEWDEQADVEFHEIFCELDTDDSGKLSFDEVKSASLKKSAQLFGHNPTDADIEDFVNHVDLDDTRTLRSAQGAGINARTALAILLGIVSQSLGDGSVSEDEFKTFLRDFLEKLQDPKKMLEDAVDTMMNAIDKDKNGFCSKEEFKAFVQSKGESPLTDDQVEDLFNAVDSDGDKTTLNRDELLTVLQIGLANR